VATVAIYHMHVKIVSRGKGKSAVAAAAYRAGECIKNEYDGMIHSYTRKKGVVHKEIILCENAPVEYANRSILWNSVEKVERYSTAQLAREVEVALPVELSMEDNIALVREYVKTTFVKAGMCADICIHDTGEGNPHAHILLTMRPIEKDGQWGAKSVNIGKRKVPTVDWSDRDKVEIWREKWAVDVNAFLRINGHKDKQIDHRSYDRQGLKIIPTIKLGSLAHRLEKRGIHTRRGDMNRERSNANIQLRQLSARLRKETELLYTTVLEDTPTIADVAWYVNSWKNISSHWQSIQNLKDAANILNFFTEYKTYDMADVAVKAKQLHTESLEITKEVQKIDHRLNTLDLHLAHVETYFAYSKISNNYKSLPEQKQAEYRERYKYELEEFKKSNDYLTGVLNGRDVIPVKMWQDEREKLAAAKLKYGEKYYKLYKDLTVIEKIRKSAEVFIEKHMPDVQRPEIVKSVTKVAPKPVQKTVIQKAPERKLSWKEQMADAKKKADEHNAQRAKHRSPKRHRDFDR